MRGANVSFIFHHSRAGIVANPCAVGRQDLDQAKQVPVHWCVCAESGDRTVSATCVIGLQWGDEAKGKLVDLLAPKFQTVVRYQGGANAGHTVVDGDKTYKLHHIPSGILHPQVMNVVAPGVVMEPNTLIKEIEGLESRGVSAKENLRISDRVHLVMPWHLIEDQILNAQPVQGENIGTTLRGIGPCYRDKVGRTFAIRLADILAPDLPQRITEIVQAKRRLLAGLATEEQLALLQPEPILDQAIRWGSALGSLAIESTTFLHDKLDAGESMLLEGAQGALLDIDHGTFPFVTSSNSSGVGVSSGSGIPGKWITKVLGVAKAYSTRVGGGPFPTELVNETGNKIREIGREYGTTTGRPRRCGWLDAFALRYTSRLSGVHAIALMMLDVLSHFETIQVCVGYELHGVTLNRFPSRAEELRQCQPVYRSFEGWNQDVTAARIWGDLPVKAQNFVEAVEKLVGVPIEIVSVGPDRQQTIQVPATRSRLD